MNEIIYCSKCQSHREEHEFAPSEKTKHYRKCRLCSRKYSQKHYKKNKEVYLARCKRNNRRYAQRNMEFAYQYLKEFKCQDCQEANVVTFEPDHVRGIKKANLSALINSAYSIDVIKQEFEKCDIVCSNCHALREAERKGAYRFMQEKLAGIAPNGRATD